MYRFSDLTVAEPPSLRSQERTDGKAFYVSCLATPNGCDWSYPRSLYLHNNGLWSECAYSDDGPTAYFMSRDAASAALAAAESDFDSRAYVIPSNIDAQVLASRDEKREFRL